MCQARVDELLGKLFPRERVTRPTFTPLNPTRADRRPGSFVIWTSGPAAGGFQEYSPAGPPAKGDILDLIAYVHRRPGDRAFALRWAEDFLGLRRMAPEELARAKHSARAQARAETRSESETLARKRQGALRLWGKSQPIVLGQGHLAESYLARRGIALAALQNPEQDLRYLPSLEHWKSAKWDGRRKIDSGPKFPVMIAALRDGAGDVTAVHCTFLRGDGSGKADVAKPKLMLGAVRGSLIRLARGPSGLTWEEAAANGVLDDLGVGEGIETCLSVALACPELRVAAAGSFDNIANAPIGHPIVDRFFLLRDNDASAAADEKVASALDALGLAGKPVTAMAPPASAKDFNDVMRGQ